MKSAAEFWDGAAEKYAKSPIGDMEAYNYTLGRIRSHLSPSDRVLEVGCGTGSTALLLAPDVREIIASDVSEKMIEIASQKALDQNVSNAKFVVAELSDRKLGDSPYDAVLALNLLHLVEDIPAAVRQFHGLLRPGGIFISKTVCEPGAGTPLKFRLMKYAIPVMQYFGKAPFVQFMKTVELESLIRSLGFEIVESGDHPPPSRFIVAKKVP